MRRIALSRLALPCILLSLTGLAAAQNVSLELIPFTSPIQIPSSGGSFEFYIFLTNNSSQLISTDIWAKVIYPDGVTERPFWGPVTEMLQPGTTGYYRSQNVPGNLPSGDCLYIAYAGVHPDSVWSADTLIVTKQALGGTELWVARYNGPGNAADVAKSIAIDDHDNVYVTGWSDGGATHRDYATIKYDASGNQIWMARYNGPGNGYDEAYAMAVDSAGSIYVTGRSVGSETNYDYATIRYDADGNQIWVARYNGPGNGEDEANSILIGGSGSVYVTGWSNGLGTYADYATIKYNASGDPIWVARYNGAYNSGDYATAMALDSADNVYATGWSDGFLTQHDYATVKYDDTGSQVWATRYNAPVNQWDEAQSIAVDGSGNVYVTGWSDGLWTGFDYATIKYDAQGDQVWIARYSGLGNFDDWATSLAVDGENIYVTGQSYDLETWGDYATIKYDAFGNQLWVSFYNGPTNSYDYANALSIDGYGNICVTGHSSGSEGDYATVKYNASGNQVWVARYNGLGTGNDEANSLVVSRDGNVHVTGVSDGIYYGNNMDYATIKYSGGNLDNWLPVEATVLGQSASGGPQEFALHQNYPNPFNASTILNYQLPVASSISLQVYDTAGRLVETLVDGWRSAGVHELTFDAGDLAAGIYFARLEAGDYVGVQKLVLIK